MILHAKNYQNWPVFYGVGKKMKVARFLRHDVKGHMESAGKLSPTFNI